MFCEVVVFIHCIVTILEIEDYDLKLFLATHAQPSFVLRPI